MDQSDFGVDIGKEDIIHHHNREIQRKLTVLNELENEEEESKPEEESSI